jgi:hypothetical protein
MNYGSIPDKQVFIFFGARALARGPIQFSNQWVLKLFYRE